MAASVAWFSYRYIIKKQWWYFLICWYVAYKFHNSAIVFLPSLPKKAASISRLSPKLGYLFFLLAHLLSDRIDIGLLLFLVDHLLLAFGNGFEDKA